MAGTGSVAAILGIFLLGQVVVFRHINGRSTVKTGSAAARGSVSTDRDDRVASGIGIDGEPDDCSVDGCT